MKRKFVKFTMLLALLAGLKSMDAQSCGSCSMTISGQNVNSYTVATGNIFCIDSTGIFMGSITLNGGTICNKGTFKPQTFVFNSGVITNYSRFVLNTSLTLDDSSKVILCERKAFLRISNSLNLSGGSFTNKGICNVATSIVYASGSFLNAGIVNCRTITGQTGILNSGIINKD